MSLSESESVGEGSNLRRLLIVLAVVVCSALVWAYLSNPSLVEDDIDLPTNVVTVTHFPALSNLTVKPDPTDSDYVWLRTTNVLMSMNTKSHEVFDYTSEIPEIRNKILTDVTHIGDNIFIGFQGGLIKYDLGKKTSKQFSTADGLASNSNIVITPDPSDPDVLWIGTFEGLSKFVISSGQIRSYKSEMGIVGTTWQPRVFHVDEKYVWLNINSNVHTNGGVARLDKRSGIWKSWGHEHFIQGDVSSRFDSFSAVAENERAVVVEDNIVYSYDAVTDTWRPTLPETPRGREPRFAVLRGNKAYFVSSSIKERDIDTGTERDIVSADIITNFGIYSKKFPNTLLYTSYDWTHNRLIIYPGLVSSEAGVGLFSLETGQLSVIPLSVLENKFKLLDAHVLDANGSNVIFNRRDSLVVYNWVTGAVRTLLPQTVSAAKILGDKVVALRLATCDMGCRSEELLKTESFIVSLDSAAVESSAVLTGTTTSAYYIGKTINDVYLLNHDYKDSNQGYLFDVMANQMKIVDLPFPPTWQPQGLYYPSSETNSISGDGPYSVSLKRSYQGGEVKILIEGPNGSHELVMAVAPAKYNHWSTNSYTSIIDYTFDPTDENTFWLGTDRGLIRIDMSTLQYRLFTTDDGLISNEVSKVVPTDDVIVIEHPGGVYLYRLPGN